LPDGLLLITFKRKGLKPIRAVRCGRQSGTLLPAASRKTFRSLSFFNADTI
jgi:hypothetical protein